ncbi:KUP/HAK/KT family potassium transporter [Paracraurococcus sp. LOR1-02]|uniref:Probable potassium transport system protein Kup n=2 Tax=Paracraurococcus lichenis TaxID=3064888 RepID=A0ABT9DZN4_9PROT|nr:KUP/HAK/KT family potassium transporter [Paracraurococcus sp. LOR1-02]MDO9709373.1 KUP/HAK/KT family potassium transporter [Paracraurococcus sp. LOR1-02]
MMLGALGVVFGDIGTSPIYAFRESLRTAAEHGTPPDQAVLGVVSLILWAVALVVAVKYVVFVMRADNQGEGGTMALLSLAMPEAGRWKAWLLPVGLAGASLFFGDAMITPAISVLSAVEGLAVAEPVLKPYVVPAALAVLAGLFLIQSRGSAHVGRLFGPVMAAWFIVLAAAGLWHALGRPGILAALDPRHALQAVGMGGGFAALGSVFLAVTGGEALYADMGHFGRPAIRIDWFAVVMPALVLNYLGQGALVLADPAAASDPFFHLFPSMLLLPAVALATAATVIASQAVISGAFALVQQAIQLGAVPRLEVHQTSEETAGQVYVPQINWLLAAAVLALVLGFHSSEALANAYGIAVAGDMLVTTILVSLVAHGRWGLPLAAVLPVAGAFLALDVGFVAANAHKIPGGGWFPLVVATISLTLVLVWIRGRAILLERRDGDAEPLARFLARLETAESPARVPGTAIYLTTRRQVVPAALALNLKHNGVLHEGVVLLTVQGERVPRIPEAERMTVEPLADGFRRVLLRFGFAERPCVMQALGERQDLLSFDPTAASWFIGREVPVLSMRPELPPWQEKLFAFLARNAVGATDYFGIPTPRVVELGTRVEM